MTGLSWHHPTPSLGVERFVQALKNKGKRLLVVGQE